MSNNKIKQQSMTFGVDDFMTTRVGGESEYEQSGEDIG
jgi:hypothetical protein